MDQLRLTEQEEQRVRDIKNHLHQNPELSWEEKETAEYIRARLMEIEGAKLLDCPVSTAVIGRIKGSGTGGGIALRADIDAIRAEELWESTCVSRVPGVSHACGHDFHTAALLGAAMILSRNRAHFNGDAILIFQPAEETTSGAAKILESGIFEEYNIRMIFGLHNRPEIETGSVVSRSGPMMAAKKNFRLTFFGLGGHGSMPQKCVDPIVCAAALVQAVQTIVSRNTDPQEALVLAIGSIHGGTCENLVVDRVEMTGSMRYFSEEVGARAVSRLEKLIEATAEAYECRAQLIYEEQLPAVINPPQMCEIAGRAVKAALGEAAAVFSEPCLASEDFALYQQRVPGFFYWLGAKKPGDACYSWHNSRFHTDDDALKYGAALLAQSVVEGCRS